VQIRERQEEWRAERGGILEFARELGIFDEIMKAQVT
jgi:hypothetical protein